MKGRGNVTPPTLRIGEDIEIEIEKCKGETNSTATNSMISNDNSSGAMYVQRTKLTMINRIA